MTTPEPTHAQRRAIWDAEREKKHRVEERLGHLYGSAPVTDAQRREVEEMVEREMEILERRKIAVETRYEN